MLQYLLLFHHLPMQYQIGWVFELEMASNEWKLQLSPYQSLDPCIENLYDATLKGV